MTQAGHPARRAPGLVEALVIVLLAALIVAAAGGCAARKPGQQFRWTAESQTRVIEGQPEVTIGIGYRI